MGGGAGGGRGGRGGDGGGGGGGGDGGDGGDGGRVRAGPLGHRAARARAQSEGPSVRPARASRGFNPGAARVQAPRPAGRGRGSPALQFRYWRRRGGNAGCFTARAHSTRSI